VIDNIQSQGASWHKAFSWKIRAVFLPGFAMTATLLCLGQDVSAPELKPEVVKKINRLADLQKNLTTMNTLGAELQVVELARTATSQGSVVGYELYAKNLPHDRQYLLSTERIDQQSVKKDKLKTLAQSGKVMDGPDDPVDLLLMAAKGEPYRFRLSSKDGKYQAFASVVPFPIIGVDKSCSVEAILLMPDAEGVLVLAKGFKASIGVQVSIDSAGDEKGGNVRTNEAGKLSLVLMPYKKDTSQGVTTVALSSTDCHPSLKFTWGKGTYHVE
jgi:hypothetical protein